MHYFTDGGHKLHYRVEGSGPLVVLLHGLLMSGDHWLQSGLVQALRERFCVVYPDLLGHGLSDKPSESQPYEHAKQAADITALIDHLGYRQAHVIGYSSGAWLAIGIAQYFPKSLLSLLIGGWDVVNGLPNGPNGPLGFDTFLSYARVTAPALTEGITHDIELALQQSFNALSRYQNMGEALQKTDIPTLFWAGQDDIYHDPLRSYAYANAFSFLSTTGDHLTAMLQPDGYALKSIASFVEQAELAQQHRTASHVCH